MLNNHAIRMWILYHNNNAVGYLRLEIKDSESEEISIFILQEYQKNGLASYLLEFAKETKKII